MEEQQWAQIINVFLRSSEFQELKVDLFDSFDTLLSSFVLTNYKWHTIRLKQHALLFYCLLTSHNYRIEEQVEVKVPDDQTTTFQRCQKFNSFTLTIEVDLQKSIQAPPFILEHFLQQENELMKFANAHLRKLEDAAIKRLELEELKKPFGEKCKIAKGANIRKVKSKLNFTTLLKLPSESGKKQKKSYVETLKSLGRGKHKPTDESEPSLEETPSIQPPLRNKKYNTLFQNNPACQTETSSKDLQGNTQVPAQDQPFYTQLSRALRANAQLSKQHQTKKSREARLSHNQQLLMLTLGEIQRQKKALEVMKRVSCNYSQQCSPIKAKEEKLNLLKLSSPYLPLSSKTFVKRKVK